MKYSIKNFEKLQKTDFFLRIVFLSHKSNQVYSQKLMLLEEIFIFLIDYKIFKQKFYFKIK